MEYRLFLSIVSLYQLLSEWIFLCNNTRSLFNKHDAKYVVRGKWKPSAVPLPPHPSSAFTMNQLHETHIDCIALLSGTLQCLLVSVQRKNNTLVPRSLLFCWVTVPTSLVDFSVPQPGYACSFCLTPPCLCIAPSSLPHRFFPSSSMFSSSLKLSYVLSMVINIYLPRKLLFLSTYCLCGCLFPLLTWTP